MNQNQMTYKDFYYWLSGYLASNKVLNVNQVAKIEEKMKEVRDIDPIEIISKRPMEPIKIPPMPNAPRIICEDDTKTNTFQ
jgi:hypothetical protein